jgi:hypothetical protein
VPSLDSTPIPVSKWEKIRKQRKLVIKKKKMKGEKDKEIIRNRKRRKRNPGTNPVSFLGSLVIDPISI